MRCCSEIAEDPSPSLFSAIAESVTAGEGAAGGLAGAEAEETARELFV